ncbi:MAG: peptidoglycan-binding protein [Litorimonas sp.]
MVSRVADDSAKPTDPSNGDDKAARSSMKNTSDQTPRTSSETNASPDTKSQTPPTTRRRKPAPSKKARANAIQTDLDKLEARLKRANGVTRKSVESLETVVSALEAGLKKSTSVQKGRLTRHVNELTERLDQQTTDMRNAVRSELKVALAEGSLADLDAALGRASMRLDKAEVSQADAIARVNKHLADIARAIDARMKAETQARRDELDGVTETLTTAIAESQLTVEKRVAAIERDSAAALNQVGDTIEKIHAGLEKRRLASSDVVVEKVNELALQTQAELDAYQTKLETRLVEVEARHLAVGTGAAERVVERVREEIRHRIDSLQQRITELENRPAETRMPQMAALPPLPETPHTHASETSQPPAMDVPPNPIQTLRDRLTSFRAPAVADSQNPYAAALLASNDVVDHEDTLTLDKMVDAPTQYVAEPPQAYVPPSPILPFPGQPAHTGPGVPPLPPFQMPTALPPLTPMDDFESAPMPDSVYSNPAYAESINARAGVMARSQSDSPMAVRVTDDGPTRRFPLPNFTNRNLRVGLMAAGAIAVALLAGRVILGSGDGPNPNTTGGGNQPVVTTDPVTPSMPLTAINGQADAAALLAPIEVAGATDTRVTPDTSTQPIGNYAENQPVIIDTAQLDTLEAAVEANNPIAQFQMGLTKLDAGQTDEGAALIRQAASANQPAALYRLAKLYEAGEGVPRDDVMARQLIERAARGGNRIAMHDLALYYTEGRGGIELSMSTAKSWFEQAARRGVVDSQFNLAILSESTEIGTTPNIEDALFWYAIAARQGDQFAVSRRDALRDTLSADKLDAIDSRIAAFAPRAIDEEANGIFNNVPWVKTSQSSNRNQVREAQALLANLGYPVGTPDGVMGVRTRSAIVEFERASGLSETGRVDRELINRLSNAPGT